MSEFPPSSTSTSTVHTQAYADAVQRAKIIIAKIDYTGKKRPLEDPKVFCPKKLAVSDSSSEYQSTPGNMGDPVAGVSVGARVPSGAPGNMSQQMAPDLNINEYMRVPDKMVGLIIGRNGEQINRLQAESGCKIQMAPDSGGQPDRVCTLTGSRDAVAKAREMINTIVNQRGRDGGPPDNGGGPSQRMGQSYTSKEEMMIPGAKVGLIIGKGGETIKQLQEKSGAKMVVIQDGPNPEYEKPLRITGDPQKVEYAKQLVLELIEEKEQYGPRGGGGGQNKQSNSNSAPWGGGDDFDQNSEGHEVVVPKNAVGVVIGKGGEMIKKIQMETGAKVQFRQLYAEGQGDQRCFLQGTPQQVQLAREMVSLLINSVNRREQEGRPRGPPRNGDAGGPGGSYGSWGGPQDNKIEVSFTVSNIKCGIIIGRGGEVIKQINAQSGAFCELDRRTQNNQNRGNRTFYIRGNPENVEAAKRIITEKVGMPISFVDSNSSQGSDGNGGGGNGGGNGNGSDYGSGYGGGQNTPVGNAQMWTYNPQWHPSQHQQQEAQPQQQTVPINTVTNQPDYSQQWIDYYRSMGMDQEADKIEQQQKVSKAGAPGQQPSQHPQSVVSTNGGSVASVGVPNVATARNAQSQPDYSAQWVEYYRNIGKMKEAEAVEAQMKQKVSAEVEAAGRASANIVASNYGAAGGASYQQQPYQQQHYPNYNPYPGYPAHQPHPAPPDQQQ